MTEKVDSLNGFVGRASRGVANAFCDSLVFMVKTTGITVGYAGRIAGGVYSAAKRCIGFGSKQTAGLFTGGLRKKFGLTKAEVQAKIAIIDNRIRDLYLEIGKIGAGSDDIDGVLASAQVEEIIELIKKLEDEGSALRKYFAELEASERQGGPVTKFSVRPRGGVEGQLLKRLRPVAEQSIKKATFPLRSDAIIFEKALQDLLAAEMDIKRLAVSELGKLGSKQAAPVLKEALAINNPELQAEIINALIQLEDDDVSPICKRFIQHPYAGVRTACVRGLYKAGKGEAAPLLIEALKDENVEVRNSAAMFLGWIEARSALTALLQVAATDSDLRVRKSAIQALENIRDEASVLPLIRLLNDDVKEIRDKVHFTLERITGETLVLDSGDDGKDRLNSINRIKDWWINKKHDVTADRRTFVQEAGAKEGTITEADEELAETQEAVAQEVDTRAYSEQEVLDYAADTKKTQKRQR